MKERIQYTFCFLVFISVAVAAIQGEGIMKPNFAPQLELLQSALGAIGKHSGQKETIAATGEAAPANTPVDLGEQYLNGRDKGCQKKPETAIQGFTKEAIANFILAIETKQKMDEEMATAMLGTQPICTLSVDNATAPGQKRLVYLPGLDPKSKARLIVFIDSQTGLVERYEFSTPS